MTPEARPIDLQRRGPAAWNGVSPPAPLAERRHSTHARLRGRWWRRRWRGRMVQPEAIDINATSRRNDTSDIIVRASTNGGRLYLSPSAGEVLGWSVEEMLQPGWQANVHPDDFANFLAIRCSAYNPLKLQV